GRRGARAREAEGDRLRPRRSRHDDLALASDRANEALQLQLERLGLGGLQSHVLHDGVEGRGAEGAPPRLEAVEGAAALRQIEGEIPRGLEDPQLAGALAR